jgi:glutamate 5-kinase
MVMERARLVRSCKRAVVKVGTAVVTKPSGSLDTSVIKGLVKDVSHAWDLGKEVIIVTSGAISSGMGRLGLRGRPDELPLNMKQACAAIGQQELMSIYGSYFARHGKTTAQILLTEEELADRTMYRNLWTTFRTLLAHQVIPIVNENDAIAVHELKSVHSNSMIRFGDNDRLSALIASKIGADLLLILSDVDGLYTGNPGEDKDAKLIDVVEAFTPFIRRLSKGRAGSKGRGGMRSKLEAAKIAVRSGIPVMIANGKKPGVIQRIFEGKAEGTLFLAKGAGERLGS